MVLHIKDVTIHDWLLHNKTSNIYRIWIAGLQKAASDLNIYTLGSKETQTRNESFKGSYTLWLNDLANMLAKSFNQKFFVRPT